MAVNDNDMEQGRLPVPSWVRTDRIVTLSAALVVKVFGSVTGAYLGSARYRVCARRGHRRRRTGLGDLRGYRGRALKSCNAKGASGSARPTQNPAASAMPRDKGGGLGTWGQGTCGRVWSIGPSRIALSRALRAGVDHSPRQTAARARANAAVRRRRLRACRATSSLPSLGRTPESSRLCPDPADPIPDRGARSRARGPIGPCTVSRRPP
jgi:hypothetical protein